MWKKLISLNLALIMIFSLLPFHALAAETVSIGDIVPVTFYANDGTDDSIVCQTICTSANLLDLYGSCPVFERDGYALVGFNTKADGSGSGFTYYPGLSTQFLTIANTDHYAQWHAVEGNYIRYLYGETSLFQDSLSVGDTVTLKDKYTFTGMLSGFTTTVTTWTDTYTGMTYTPGQTITLTDNMTLEATLGLTVSIKDGESTTEHAASTSYNATTGSLFLYVTLPELNEDDSAVVSVTADGAEYSYYPGRKLYLDPDGDRTVTVTRQAVDGLFIRYVSADGSQTSIVDGLAAGEVTLADQFTFTTDDGQRVIRWYPRDYSTSYTPGNTFTLTENTTFFAQMGAGIITFHDCSAYYYSPGSTYTGTYYYGSAINRAPSRSQTYDSATGTYTAYYFAGWNSEADGSGDWYTSFSPALGAPADLYPQWVSYTSKENVYFLCSATGAILESGRQTEKHTVPDSGVISLPTGLEDGTAGLWSCDGTYYYGGASVDMSDHFQGRFYPTALIPGSYQIAVSEYGACFVCQTEYTDSTSFRDFVDPYSQMSSTRVLAAFKGADGTVYHLTDTFDKVCTGLSAETGGAVILTPVYEDVTEEYILYYGNGGTDENGRDFAVQDGLTLDISVSFTVAENPFTHPEGKVFVGWSTNSWNSGLYMPGDSISIFTASSYLYAQWAKYGRFIFHYTDASGNEYTNIYTDSLYTPTRSDAVFAGWNTKEDGSGDWYTSASDIVSYNYKHGTTVELYAQWASYPSGVDYVVVKGRFADGTSARVISAENGTVTFPASSEMASAVLGWSTSYNYSGWTDSSKIIPAGTAAANYTSGYTYYSVSAASSITYHGNGATTSSGADTRTYIVNSSAYSLTLYPYYNVFSDYSNCGVFREWNTEADGSGTAYTETYTTMEPGVYDLYAIWKQYITLNCTSATLRQGETLQLTATLSSELPADTQIYWSYTGSNVVFVNNGLVTANGGGTSIVEAYCWVDGNYYAAACTITVPTSVTLDTDNSSTIWVGNNETYTVTATVDEGLEDQSVTWSSSDESVAVVSADGNTCTVIPRGTGSVTITATAADGTSASFQVYFDANLYISSRAWSMNVGATYTFTAYSYLSDDTVTWSSSDPTVATIDASTGLVTALKGGTTTITATASDGTFVTHTLTVRYNTSIAPSISKTTLWVGDTTRFGVFCEGYENGLDDITWTVDNTGSVTLTETLLDQKTMKNMTDEELEEAYMLLEMMGYDPNEVMNGTFAVPVYDIKGVAPGTTTITFTGSDGNSATVTIIVRSFSLSTESNILVPGETAAMTATDMNGADVSVTWKSSDENVATVDKNGIVTAVSTGGTLITATDKNGVSLTTRIDVVDIRIKNDGVYVYPGGTVQLEAVVNPALSDQTITWSSYTPACATVDQSGLVTGISTDGYTVRGVRITATLSNGSSATAWVYVAETFINVDPYQVLGLNRISFFSVIMRGVADGSELTLTMSDPSVATAAINRFEGNENWSFASVCITALKEGTTTLTITAANGASTQILISVTDMEMSRESATLIPGESLTLSVTGGEELTWASSDETVATVDESGAVTAVSCGSAWITATDKNGAFVVCEVEVQNYRLEAEGLEDGRFLTLTLGETRQASVILSGELASSVSSITWTSYDTSVATVSETGLITAVGEGGAEVEVCIETTTGLWYYDYLYIEVISGLSLSWNSMQLGTGESRYLYLYYYGDDIEDVEWSVKGTTVISVERDDSVAVSAPDGCQTLALKVTGKKAGTATITVEAPDGTEAVCTVTVNSFYIASPDPDTLTLIPGEKTTLKAVKYEDDSAASVSWSSSDKSVLTVTSKGVVTAVAPGSATVTAKASDGSTSSVTFRVLSIALRAEDNETVTCVGGKLTLVPALSEDLDASDLTWSSSDDTIAKVSQKGIVTGVSLGSAKITVTAPDGSSGSLWISIEPAIAFFVTHNEINLYTAPGESINTSLYLRGCEVEDLTVLVEDPTVVSVSVQKPANIVYPKNLVQLTTTHLIPGNSDVIITAPNGDSVTIHIHVSSFHIDREIETVLLPGEKSSIALLDAAGNEIPATWNVSDESVLTVSDGILSAVGLGSASITATTADGIVTFDFTTVVVLRVENRIDELEIGQSHTYEVSLAPGYTECEIVATAGDLNVIAINGSTITAVKSGTVEVSFSIPGVSFAARDTVTVPSKNVTLDRTEVSLAQGETVTLKATVTNLSSSKVTWSSDNTEVATVSSSGKVTPKKAGTAVITATASDGSTASCTVTVTRVLTGITFWCSGEKVTSLTLSKTAEGSEWNKNWIYLMGTDKNGDLMTLSDLKSCTTLTSSKETVLTAEPNIPLSVYLLAPGSSTLKATYKDPDTGKSYSASLKITVEQLPTTVTITNAAGGAVETAEVAAGKSLTLNALLTPDSVTEDDVVWEIVRMVDADGNEITPANYANYAKLSNGKLTATKTASIGLEITVQVAAAHYAEQWDAAKKQENALYACYTMEDLTKGSDNVYRTPDGRQVFIAVDAPITKWLGGNSLMDYVNTYGDSYFDTSDWQNLVALMDDDGFVPLTDKSLRYLITTVTGNPAWGEDETCIPYYLFYEKSDLMEGSLADICVITVKDYHNSITLYGEDGKKVSSLTAGVGNTAAITAVVLNTSKNEVADPGIVWTSSDATIATVDEDGVITGVASGKATITATTSQGKTAKVTVTVEQFPKTIEILDAEDEIVSGTALTVGQGQNVTLTAQVGPDTAKNKTVVWETSDKTIATVSSGKVTVVKTAPAGSEVTITARSKVDSTLVASVTIRVASVAKGLAVFDKNGEAVTKLTFAAAEPGDRVQLSAALADLAGSPMDGNYDGVTWTSAKTGIATVDKNGKVTAVSKGSAKITATYTDPATGKKYTASCTVTVSWMSDQVTTTLAGTEQTVSVGKTLTLKAAASRSDGLAAGNTKVVWSSDDEEIATVTSAGKVTGVSVGTCTITATAADGSGATLAFTVTVTPTLTKVTISPTSQTVTVGETVALRDLLTLTFKDMEYSDDLEEYLSYTFTSAKESVATVDEDGIVTVCGTGSAKITIKVTCGSVTKSVTFTVKGVAG